MQPIGNTVLQRIRTHVLPSFEPSDERLPGAVCARCTKILAEIDKGVKSADALPTAAKIVLVSPSKITRQNRICSCEMCETARFNPIGMGLGTWKPEPHPVGRPSTSAAEALPPSQPVVICQRCHSLIGRGLPHFCTQTQRRDNLFTQLSLDQRGAELHASSVIKAKVATEGTSSSIRLATRGRDLTVNIGQPTNCGGYGDSAIPAKEFSRFQQTLGLSGRQAKLAAQFLRAWHGRSSLEPHLRARMDQLDSQLDDLYSAAELEMDCGKSEKQQRTVVYCTDVLELADRIMANRRHEVDGSALVKIGIDSGGDFLKFCISITASNQAEDVQVRSRQRYTDGACRQHFADGGVKKLLLLAVSPAVSESYENLQQILNLLCLQGVSFCIAADMKMTNAILGLQCCSSTHPCPWCETSRDNFSNPGRTNVLRSIGGIRLQAIDYQRTTQELGGRRVSAAAFKNCVRAPLLDLPDSTIVLHAIPPMGLHLLLGVTGRLFEELDTRLHGLPGRETIADDWLKQLGLQKPARHGASFTGNQCERLLNGVDILEAMLANHGAFCAMPVVHAMRCFRNVKTSCFGMEVQGNFESTVRTFEAAYLDLGIRVTPKVHTVVDHVVQFLCLQRTLGKPMMGLGFWSEQVVEAAHHDFSSMWSTRFQVGLDHPSYADRLRRCVVTYCSQHL